jgi:putative ABC transport system substrate-binding protein
LPGLFLYGVAFIECRLIAALTTPGAISAKKATDTVPILFELGSDPVVDGLIASVNRPGGNVTGVSNLTVGLIAKHIEVMHQVAPDAKLIAVLINPGDHTIIASEMEDASGSHR